MNNKDREPGEVHCESPSERLTRKYRWVRIVTIVVRYVKLIVMSHVENTGLI